MKEKKVIAKVVGVDCVHIKILCPFGCKQKYHYHGSCGGSVYGSSRSSHCRINTGTYYLTKKIYSLDGKHILYNKLPDIKVVGVAGNTK